MKIANTFRLWLTLDCTLRFFRSMRVGSALFFNEKAEKISALARLMTSDRKLGIPPSAEWGTLMLPLPHFITCNDNRLFKVDGTKTKFLALATGIPFKRAQTADTQCNC